MRINSANMEMESVRSYHSYSWQTTSSVLAVNRGGISKKDKSSGDVISGDSNNKNKGRETGTKKESELYERLKEMDSYSGVKRLSYSNKGTDTLSTIRENCMNFLMQMFYRESKMWNYTEVFTGVRSNPRPSLQPVTETLYLQQKSYYEEQEDTSFSTKGTVKCADGREISFNVEVQMSRSFFAYYEENYQQLQTRMCDPLVINLDGNVAQLDDQKFFFDIDADGVEDEISTLSKGSGYLALDKNGDGVINDGNELFGAQSGNGFSDLAEYDSDGNGWIDEGDEIWNKLLIWAKDENGKDTCYSLSEKQVGAICLSSNSTDFSLNSADNKVNGRIRRTGIFLYENGNVGTVQHLDVAQ